MSRRLGLATLSAIAAAALIVPAAQASPPYILHFNDLPAVYTDDALCQYAPFNFDVQVNGSDHATIREYADRLVFVDKFRGTVTGPKNTLAKSEDAVITEDFATDNQTWNGLAEGYATLAGKNVARDTGEITFDTNGNIVSEHGQHPIAEGPGNDAVCTALSS